MDRVGIRNSLFLLAEDYRDRDSMHLSQGNRVVLSGMWDNHPDSMYFRAGFCRSFSGKPIFVCDESVSSGRTCCRMDSGKKREEDAGME